MLRHLFITALRDLARNPVQSFIAIGGLAIGLAAAILAGILTANQYSYDHFIPGSGQIYYTGLVVENLDEHGTNVTRASPLDLAKYLHQEIPEIAITRILESEKHLRHGGIEAKETLYWADPNVFQLLPLPVLYGNLDKALARPDGIVIPRTIAEKYFGRDNVVGETLQLERQHVLTVTAVIADLPANATTLQTGIFASSQAAFSPVTIQSARPSMGHDGSIMINADTLVRISPNLSVSDLQRRASAMVDSFVPRSMPFRRALRFVPMDRLHLSSVYPGIQTRVFIFDAVFLLILLLACVNFVNLSTARAARRGVEIGLRKAAGAARQALIAQFLGESVLQAFVALAIAIILVEWTLPAVNSFLNAGAVFNYWRDPLLAAALVSGTLGVGILAGAYPALILSAFRPAAVLKGLATGSGKSAVVRQVLVTVQFTILVTLLIAAGMVFLQERYATMNAMRLNTDQMLVVKVAKCEDAFKAQVAALPGVRGVACSDTRLQPDHSKMFDPVALRGGGYLPVSLVSVGFGLFEIYGLKPLAGRFFAADHGGDAIPDPAAPNFTAHFVLNQTAIKQLGFASPQAALGQMVNLVPGWVANGLPAPPQPHNQPPISTPLRGAIIGVVRDFAMTSGDKQIDPTVYSVGVPNSGPAKPDPEYLLNVKLSGRGIPETLSAIDALWRKTGSIDSIDRTFVDAYIENLEIAVLRQAQAFAVFAGFAMFLGCLGLFGLSLSTTKRRIKEIGIRKAMGATSADIVLLLLWQFSKPVLWASLIAWPLAYWAMHRWLAGFAHHVDLPMWLFLAASLASLTVATLTVAGQAIAVALQKPVLALRYE